jgi:erythromycin esterase-like protein
MTRGETTMARASPAVLAAALSLCWFGDASALDSKVVPVDLGASGYGRIAHAAGTAKVVSLGESIHLTREMPKVRLEILRRLHQQHGFQVLAFEGSLMDSWTAQEHAYSSRAPLSERARKFAREAWFGLWQTEEMEEVAAYALSTQTGPKPLYLTSFDIQPGQAFAYRGSADRALEAFLVALRTASPTVDEAQIDRWTKVLGPGLACKAEAPGEAAVEEIDRWITQDVAPALASLRPAVHVRTLKLAPRMLRSRLAHCQEVKISGRQVYQAARDRLNAELVRAMLTSEPKLVLWAHHSHVHHNSQGAAPISMGQQLKTSLGSALYTIGVFASGGEAIDSLLADQSEDGLAPRPVPRGPRFSMEWRLSSLSPNDVFVDLRGAGEPWSIPLTSRLEVQGRMKTTPAADFDGAVLLHEVSAPWLTFMPRPGHGAPGAGASPR